MEIDQIIKNRLKKVPEDKLGEVEETIDEMKAVFERSKTECQKSLICTKCKSPMNLDGDMARCTKCSHKFKWFVQDMRELKL